MAARAAKDADGALMLSIGKLGASQGQLEYYEEQVAAGAEDYYAGRGEVAGVWVGSGASAIGLTLGSTVSRDGFMRLMRCGVRRTGRCCDGWAIVRRWLGSI